MELSHPLKRILDQVRSSSVDEAVEEFSRIYADNDKEHFITMLQDWRRAYAVLSLDIRICKSYRRKGPDKSKWQSRCAGYRNSARNMMKVRHVLGQLGKRHWEKRESLAA